MPLAPLIVRAFANLPEDVGLSFFDDVQLLNLDWLSFVTKAHRLLKKEPPALQRFDSLQNLYVPLLCKDALERGVSLQIALKSRPKIFQTTIKDFSKAS